MFFLVSLAWRTLSILGIRPGNSFDVSDRIFELLFFSVIASVVALEFAIALTQRNLIKNLFGRFVDSTIADKLMNQKTRMPLEYASVAVMFCDIRSFVTITSFFPIESVGKMLQEYRKEMTKVIKKHDGYVYKFIL